MLHFVNKRVFLAAFVCSFLAALLRFHTELFSSTPLIDEVFYVSAAQILTEGGQTSDVAGYYYSDIFAWLLSQLLPVLTPSLMLLRLLNAAGNCLCFAAAGAIVARQHRPTWAPVVSVLLTLALPYSWHVFCIGNISGVMFLPLVLALLVRSSALQSFLLALACFPKPYALGVAITRPLLVLLLPAAVVLLATLTSPAAADSEHFRAVFALSNNSPARVLAMLGLPWQLSTAAFLGAAYLTARGQWMRGICLGWLALPVTWAHSSLILFVPLAMAYVRWSRAPSSRRRMLSMLALVFVLVVLLQLKFFGVAGLPWVLELLVAAIPSGAVLLLAWLTTDQLQSQSGLDESRA